MSEIISNTSPLQYLHQLGLLGAVHRIVGQLIVPPAVVAEIEEGKVRGVDLPDLNQLDWVLARTPQSHISVPLVTDLGPGETEVLTDRLWDVQCLHVVRTQP